ncbi:unnamed protein product [Cyprideis torosa]|uniref:Palmitoyltransferase n=1 Tax=Cyprideis torosa TaxID=163714 RepID=A0A7R8W2M3_9CRUS|nr:unnamed protein product [Cyprideis torosa]CAG0882091.1 unnamed protein product [Cyprideis torosa]
MPSRTVTTRNYASYQPVSAAEPQSSDQETTALQTIDLLDDSDDDVDYQLRMGGKSGTTRVPQRRWEIHPGKNKFSCQGRIVMAKQTGIFLFTVTLICLTSALWFVFDAPYLARRLSLAIPITGGVMFLYVLSTLLRTSFMDPGIIPRAKPDEAKDLEKQFGLERFDHHCPWVGNCVGKRNYRFFYMFISSLAFYCVFVFVCTVTHIALLVYDKEQKFIDAVKESPTSILVAAICFLSVWSILGLTGFHTYLVLGNQTTNEDIKGSFVSRRASNGQPHNPYRSPHGPCGNCCAVLCGPFYPSVLNATELLGSDWSENQPGGDSMRYGTVTTTQPQPPTAQVTTEKPGNSVVACSFMSLLT